MCFRRLALGSLTKIFDAPTALQTRTTSAPIGPPPVTRTVLPLVRSRTLDRRKVEFSGLLVRSRTLDRRKVEFSGLLVRSRTLDRRKVEFSGLYPVGGLGAPAGVTRETGGLLPIAPCGRTSL